MRLREITFLPIMIVVIVIAFSVRLVDVYSGFRGFPVFETQGVAQAADKNDSADVPKDEASAEAEPKGETGKEEAAKEDEELKTHWRDSNDEDFGFASVKQAHEDDLVARTQALDKRAQSIRAQEALIKAAQKEMNRKYLELTQIRKQIEGLLENQEGEENERIASLVRIYENMKAKEAAAIFNTLDLDILVQVLSNMTERKASPIIAKMNPERAKTVTIMLAEEKKLPTLN